MIPTDSNFLEYAALHYEAPFPDIEEFQEDLKRIIYIKRLFNAYADGQALKERLILNHLVILYNVFSVHATPMLFLKLKDHQILLKTFLSFLDKMPEQVPPIDNPPYVVYNRDIPLDAEVWRKLQLI